MCVIHWQSNLDPPRIPSIMIVLSLTLVSADHLGVLAWCSTRGWCRAIYIRRGGALKLTWPIVSHSRSRGSCTSCIRYSNQTQTSSVVAQRHDHRSRPGSVIGDWFQIEHVMGYAPMPDISSVTVHSRVTESNLVKSRQKKATPHACTARPGCRREPRAPAPRREPSNRILDTVSSIPTLGSLSLHLLYPTALYNLRTETKSPNARGLCSYVQAKYVKVK